MALELEHASTVGASSTMPRILLAITAAGFIVALAALAGCSRQSGPTGSNVVSSPMLSSEQITALKPIIPPQLGEPMAYEPSVEDTVADALARIGGEAVPFLIETLEDPDAEVRMYAARSLALMGSPAQAAVPALTKHLKDPDVRVRRTCARALGQMGPAARDAVPALIKLLIEEGRRSK